MDVGGTVYRIDKGVRREALKPINGDRARCHGRCSDRRRRGWSGIAAGHPHRVHVRDVRSGAARADDLGFSRRSPAPVGHLGRSDGGSERRGSCCGCRAHVSQACSTRSASASCSRSRCCRGSATGSRRGASSRSAAGGSYAQGDVQFVNIASPEDTGLDGSKWLIEFKQ